MSSAWVIVGTIGQLFLGMFMLLITIFGGAGVVDHASRAGRTLSSLQSGIIDWSIYLLPALCFASAGIVIYLYKHGGGVSSYWWYLPPVIASGLYWWFVAGLYT